MQMESESTRTGKAEGGLIRDLWRLCNSVAVHAVGLWGFDNLELEPVLVADTIERLENSIRLLEVVVNDIDEEE